MMTKKIIKIVPAWLHTARGLRWLVLACGVFLTYSGFAQLVPVPLERSAPSSSAKTKATSSKRTKSDTPLLLPFFDDFSGTPVFVENDPYSGFPSESLWEDSYDVWISEGLGINAPSLHVATLDGLDSAGKPYSNQALENGYRDILMSRAIDLSTDYVGLGERSGVYLSFFYQWQGNGEAPDASDFFRVEFLTADSTWVTALTITTVPDFTRDQFYQAIVQVNGEQFFSKKFRFRFRNYGRLSGPYDSWHLDYIYLNKGRNANSLTYPDRAIASSVGPVFGDYYSIPIDHFRAAPTYTPPKVDIQSLRGGPDGAPTDYTVQFTFDNYTDDALTRATMPFGPVGSKYPDNNLQPGERYRSTIATTSSGIDFNDPGFDRDAYFLPEADRTDLRISLGIYEPDEGIFSSNDTISQVYHLHDFYAYDDGTAEYAVVLSEADDQVAYRFDVLAPGPQQLVGFDVYIPTYSISGFTTAEFFVLDVDENGEPGDRLTAVTHVVRTNPRNHFQRVNIEPVVVEGQFYIGWKGSATNKIRVGIDYSNNTVDRIYEDFNGIVENGKIKWYPVSALTEGSLMLRPNFGEAGPISGVTPDREAIAVYPNPSEGAFTIRSVVERLQLMNISGQPVQFSSVTSGDETHIRMNNPVAGMYLLRFTKGGQIYTKKLVVK